MVSYYDSEIELDSAVPILAVSGETDLYTAPQFKRDVDEVMSLTSGGVVLDLTDLELIESTALAVLLAALQQAIDEGRALALVITRQHVLRVFTVTGLLNAFFIASTREDAIAVVLGRSPLRSAA